MDRDPYAIYEEGLAAARRWRDEQREQVSHLGHLPEQDYRLVWLDTGSGPGVQVLVPEA